MPLLPISRVASCVVGALFVGIGLVCAEVFAGEAAVDFRRDIYPLLRGKCFHCHEGAEAEAGSRLDLREELLGETNGRPLVEPGNSAGSRLIALVTSSDPKLRMPPEGAPLSNNEIELLRQWIDAGVAWDAELLPPLATHSDHWAFQPVRRPAIPSKHSADDETSAVDNFLQDKRAAAGLAIAPGASRRMLLRRASFVLTGLPPEAEAVRSFEADSNPDAYERRIDQLLAAPAFGERWGRHWLDVARWAESEGFESNHPRAFAWRYRDYVVEAFNKDLPYNQFLTQQIAGDELPKSDQNLVATGFLAAARISSNEEDKWLQRNDVNVDIVNALGSGVLGITLHCAQCHNHKFDPISARDYYRLQAFFLRGQPTPVRLDDHATNKEGVDQLLKMIALRQTIFEAARARFLEEVRRQLSNQERALLEIPASRRTIAQEVAARKVGLIFERTADGIAKFIPEADRKLYDELKKRIADCEKESPISQAFAYYSPVTASHEREILPALGFYPLPFDKAFFQSVQPRILVRGDVHSLGPTVSPGFPAVLTKQQNAVSAERELTRLDLANWLADPANPLVGRVWVNRLWQYVFGTGMVPTADDFGVRGDRPSHPELLDWLTYEWSERGRQTKPILRQLLTSQAFRLSSRPGTSAEADPDNRLLTRWKPRRLEAEALRDAALAASGELDGRLGGASAPDEQRETTTRRSLYLYQRRGRVADIQSFFDGPNECAASCAKRDVSTSPLQALLLMNSPFSIARAKALAERVKQHTSADGSDEINTAFLLALGRAPNTEELAAARKLCSLSSAATEVGPLVLLCQSLLNLNEFAYVD